MKTPIIDFDIFVENHLPTEQREPKWEAWIKGLLSQIKRLNKIFRYFIEGSETVLEWDNSTAYLTEDEVYYNFSVYKALLSSTNVQPDLNPLSWQKILESEIGTSLSSRFTFNKMIFEYSLNKYFQRQLTANGFTGFKQPDSPISPTNSDIYVITSALTYPSFICGETEILSDNSELLNSSRYSTRDEDFTALSVVNITIMIPSLVYSSINSDPIKAEAVVRNFVKRYIIAGIIYKIDTY